MSSLAGTSSRSTRCDLRQQLADGIDAARTVSRVPPSSWMTSARCGTATSKRGSSIRPCKLVGLTPEREQQDAAEIGMAGIAKDRAPQELVPLAGRGHGTAGRVGEGDDPVDGGVVSRSPRFSTSAAMKRETLAEQFTVVSEPDHVACPDLAVAAAEATERARGDRARRRWASLGKRTGDLERPVAEIVDVDMVAWRDGDRGAPDDVAVLAHGLSGRDRMQGDLVTGRDGSGGDQLPAIDREDGSWRGVRPEHGHVVVGMQQDGWDGPIDALVHVSEAGATRSTCQVEHRMSDACPLEASAAHKLPRVSPDVPRDTLGREPVSLAGRQTATLARDPDLAWTISPEER